MEESAGSSDKEMSIIESSLSYKANKLRESWTGIAQGFVDRGDLGKVIDALTKLSEAIEFVTSKLGLLKTAAVGIGAALSIKNVGINTLVAY
jgi:hypothetical protein|nr:MAG TPA: hypothetical protein [Caudoviricetes sp.]